MAFSDILQSNFLFLLPLFLIYNCSAHRLQPKARKDILPYYLIPILVGRYGFMPFTNAYNENDHSRLRPLTPVFALISVIPMIPLSGKATFEIVFIFTFPISSNMVKPYLHTNTESCSLRKI